jgi:hypothetical protein
MRASVKPGVVFPETIYEENIPCELIYDIIDGKPYCSKPNQGMLQHLVISNYLLRTLFEGLLGERNLMVAGRPGLFINERNVFTSDIMIFERNKLTIDENYAVIPPKITLNLDVKVDLGDMTEDEYIILKASRLINFGVKKVIWFFANAKKVVIVDRQCWASSEWDVGITILPGITCNVGQYLRSEGSRFA